MLTMTDEMIEDMRAQVLAATAARLGCPVSQTTVDVMDGVCDMVREGADPEEVLRAMIEAVGLAQRGEDLGEVLVRLEADLSRALPAMEERH